MVIFSVIPVVTSNWQLCLALSSRELAIHSQHTFVENEFKVRNFSSRPDLKMGPFEGEPVS